ncbi:MAG: hypothetical protein EXS50_02230 [Candidatus Taylorbacteria bacterium]|nr:hypothetical protein [Candidatus Taylorbacteria bacterium]
MKYLYFFLLSIPVVLVTLYALMTFLLADNARIVILIPIVIGLFAYFKLIKIIIKKIPISPLKEKLLWLLVAICFIFIPLALLTFAYIHQITTPPQPSRLLG